MTIFSAMVFGSCSTYTACTQDTWPSSQFISTQSPRIPVMDRISYLSMWQSHDFSSIDWTFWTLHHPVTAISPVNQSLKSMLQMDTSFCEPYPTHSPWSYSSLWGKNDRRSAHRASNKRFSSFHTAYSRFRSRKSLCLPISLSFRSDDSLHCADWNKGTSISTCLCPKRNVTSWFYVSRSEPLIKDFLLLNLHIWTSVFGPCDDCRPHYRYRKSS